MRITIVLLLGILALGLAGIGLQLVWRTLHPPSAGEVDQVRGPLGWAGGRPGLIFLGLVLGLMVLSWTLTVLETPEQPSVRHVPPPSRPVTHTLPQRSP
ncbi:MAG: hypothetical protein HQL82_05465 [Magnetococcales bacterium]|nr:hypothetical protein [Magnetococcales bacterium]